MIPPLSEIKVGTFAHTPSALATDKAMVMGHRGASAIAPENTLSAFEIAAKHNITWIEVDADILGDGTVVISHDAELERCTNKSGLLQHLTQSDLAFIDAGSWFSDDFLNEPLPTLKTLIEFTNRTGMNLNLEIKSGSNKAITEQLISGVIADINRYWSGSQQLLISSFNHLLLSEIKRRAPEVSLACLFDAPLPSDWLTSMQYVEADFIHPCDTGLTQTQVSAMLSAGYQVNVWTVNDLRRANQLINWGVKGICSDIAHKFPRAYRQRIGNQE